MDDTDTVHRIGELAAEEHALERSHEGEELSPHDQERLEAVAAGERRAGP